MLIVGTDVDEVLNGTLSSDIIYGQGGADYILADEQNNTPSGGNDVVFGELGNDIIYAYVGNDRVYGQDGNDQLFASVGDDTAHGGAGNDTLDGENGNDILLGDLGDDAIVGGADSDFISGGAGSDVLKSHNSLVSNFVVEKDIMNGGSGFDIFRLRTDYLGGRASLNPRVDGSHARIEDFAIGQDVLDLRYGSGYTIRYSNYFGNPALDTIISYQGNAVAVVQDTQLTSANLS